MGILREAWGTWESCGSPILGALRPPIQGVPGMNETTPFPVPSVGRWGHRVPRLHSSTPVPEEHDEEQTVALFRGSSDARCGRPRLDADNLVPGPGRCATAADHQRPARRVRAAVGSGRVDAVVRIRGDGRSERRDRGRGDGRGDASHHGARLRARHHLVPGRASARLRHRVRNAGRVLHPHLHRRSGEQRGSPAHARGKHRRKSVLVPGRQVDRVPVRAQRSLQHLDPARRRRGGHHGDGPPGNRPRPGVVAGREVHRLSFRSERQFQHLDPPSGRSQPHAPDG